MTGRKDFALDDPKINIRLRLSASWASVMLCYIYGDIFSFFKPGFVADVAAGRTGALGTQLGLLAAATLMAIPSVMVLLCLVLGAGMNRWANIVLGAAYTFVILATMPGAWWFYRLLGVIEAAITVMIAWQAWRWPGQTKAR